ncbi:MAG: hypothetical protein M3680_18165 [Myxococcota bacterium]|nr:hypothetical protein [Myxococcota bacterium]
MFATPFVIVVGCSQPADRAVVATGPTLPATQRDAAAPVLATADAAADPAPDPELTHERWAERKAAHEAGVQACARVAHPCNPPPPPPPEPPLRGEVIDHVTGAAGGLVINLRVAGPVDTGWHGVFLDDRGAPIAGTELVVVKRLSGGLVRATLRARALPSRTVRLVRPST